MKKMIKSISIHYKLTFIIVAVSALVLGISVSIFYKSQLDILEHFTIKNAETQASLISSSVESAIIFNDERSAENTLKILEHDNEVEFAAILFPDKKIFVSYIKNKNSEAPEINTNKKTHIESNNLDITHEILDQGQIIGYTFIRFNIEDLKTHKVYYRNTVLAIISFSIFLSYILSSYFKKIITSPLDIIVKHAKELSKTKNYDKRLELDLHDELGTLVSGFNLMLDAVKSREQELKDHSDHLQELVDERTEQLYQKAHYDALTQLPNRYLLLDRLNHAILAAQRKSTCIAVLFLDLDRFKVINDSLGHDIGDLLLQETAKRLKKAGRDIDTIARLGGDEFIFLLEEMTHPEDAARVARRIQSLFSNPFQLEKHTLHVTTSIGISIFPDDGDNDQKLLKNADVSMYHSKEKGPGNYSFYEEKMNQSSYERLKLENMLRNAVENNEFHLVYQPQVTLENGEINNVEALLRWINPESGNIAPGIFIPVAEEIGIINQIGRWVITEVCRQINEWSKKGQNNITVAINISASHLLGTDIIKHIKDQVSKFNIEYNKLELEITEEVFLAHSEQTIAILKELQSLDIKIAVDDFGTGYSSLQYLKNLPVDTLKLDGMFIADLQSNTSSQGITSSTIILAHSLNMKLIAECVETEQQLDFLKQQGCDLVQGYYLYKPLHPEEILDISRKAMKSAN